ncbi:hypothetical protein D3C87_1851050 [compost metagenome]
MVCLGIIVAVHCAYQLNVGLQNRDDIIDLDAHRCSYRKTRIYFQIQKDKAEINLVCPF